MNTRFTRICNVNSKFVKRLCTRSSIERDETFADLPEKLVHRKTNVRASSLKLKVVQTSPGNGTAGESHHGTAEEAVLHYRDQ
jgi:hypothetical protein